MIRVTLSILSALALTALALTFTTNPASAYRQSSSSTQGGQASPDGLWHEIDDAALQRRTAERQTAPQSYRTLHLNQDTLRQVLRKTSMEFSEAAKNTQVVMSLPMPDGTFARFRIEESPIMEPELAAKFPETKTYRGQGIDDPKLATRFDWTPQGFHALVISGENTVAIHPYRLGDTTNYICYYGRDYKDTAEEFTCLVTKEHIVNGKGSQQSVAANTAVGAKLRTYRIAIATTQEYTNDMALGGGTADGALASVNTWLNGVNLIYELELSVRMNLVANNDMVIFRAEPDGFTNGTAPTMVGEVRDVLRDRIGQDNYHVGHVLGTPPGGVHFSSGLAYTGVVCNNGRKSGEPEARGPLKGGGVTLVTGAGVGDFRLPPDIDT